METEKNPGGPPPLDLEPIDLLRAEYARRREKNPQYSLRAFARSLKMKSGPLSEILNRKRKLSPKLGARLVDRLGLSPQEAERFLGRLRPGGAQLVTDEVQRYQQLSADTFFVISDWYHYSLLSLMETKGFQSDPKWIAARLGISVMEANAAIERMLRIGLLQKVRGRLSATGNFAFASQRGIPSSALRKFHRQVLERALRQLDEAPLELRDVSSITLAIDVRRIAEASQAIKKFRYEMAELLEQGSRTEVYHLNIQLVPVSGTGGKA